MFTATTKLAAIERELGFRRRVYARSVDSGRMTQAKMDEEIAVFEALRDDYSKLAEGDHLL